MNLEKEFDQALDLIQAILLSILIKLGPFLVALVPALFTGYSIFHTFKESGPQIALIFAVTVALGVETVEIVVTHVAVKLYNGWNDNLIQPGKFWIMAAMVPIAATTISLTIANSGEAFVPLVRALGIASPFLTVMVNMAVALSIDLKDVRQVKTEEKRQKRQDRLAKKLSSNGVKNANIDTVNANRRQKKDDQVDRIIDIYLDNPNAGVSQVSRQVNVSRQTVYNYLTELEQEGRIHRNGDGVKVIR